MLNSWPLATLLFVLIMTVELLAQTQAAQPPSPPTPAQAAAYSENIGKGSLAPVRAGYPSNYPTPPPPEPMDLSSASVKSTTMGQGTIYAGEANVPPAALQEYLAGLAILKTDLKAAEQHLLRATQLYPKYSSAFNALGVAYALDQEKQDKNLHRNTAAENAFHQALVLNPYNEDALSNLGDLLLRENAAEEAEQFLRKAVAIQSKSTKAFVRLMMAQSMQHHYADVLSTARRIPARELDKFPMIYFLRAVAWENKPNKVQAIRDYREFLKHSPDPTGTALAQAALGRLQSNKRASVN